MQAKINGSTTVNFTPDSDNALKGNDFELSIINESTNEVRIALDGKKYTGRLLQLNAEEKKVVLKVNGHRFSIALTDEYDSLLKSLGMGAGAIQKVNELKAPMPGVVFEIKVKVGDSILKDDPILVLEAMKMENILKSPVDAVIKSILVEKGNTVEKNKVLIEFE